MPKRLNKKGERIVGRSKGTPNKITKTQRELMLNILRNEEEKIVKTLAGLGGVTYLKYVAKLIELITPKTNLDPVVEPIQNNSPEAIIERAQEEWNQKVEEDKAKEIKIEKPIRKRNQSVMEMIEEKRLLDLEKEKQNGA